MIEATLFLLKETYKFFLHSSRKIDEQIIDVEKFRSIFESIIGHRFDSIQSAEHNTIYLGIKQKEIDGNTVGENISL